MLLFFERLIFATTIRFGLRPAACCELLLFFERLIFATTFLHLPCPEWMLWIAFVLWKIDICYNLHSVNHLWPIVVNCFCSLKDWYLLQRLFYFCINVIRCELLLFFERLIFATTSTPVPYASLTLWIAFVLWKIDICYNFGDGFMIVPKVVNCFCSLKDWYLLQLPTGRGLSAHRCELLLFFERLIFATTRPFLSLH